MSIQIKVSTIINGDAARVWDRWTKADHMVHWNFASPDWCCPKAQIDLRVGGKMNVRMEARDGSFGFDFEAIYDEVVPRKRLAYTMTDGRRAVTDFEAVDGKTKVTTTFDAEGAHPVEMQRDGWQAILENFKNYLEN